MCVIVLPSQIHPSNGLTAHRISGWLCQQSPVPPFRRCPIIPLHNVCSTPSVTLRLVTLWITGDHSLTSLWPKQHKDGNNNGRQSVDVQSTISWKLVASAKMCRWPAFDRFSCREIVVQHLKPPCDQNGHLEFADWSWTDRWPFCDCPFLMVRI